MADAKQYIDMQLNWYNHIASKSSYESERKHENVVGSYEAHDSWPDYDRFLMRGVDASYRDKLALDFACGPARNIVRYHHLFRRIDGADISPINIENAKKNLQFHGVEVPRLYVTNGDDVGDIASNTYDFILSTIAMQHICVHKIRYSIFAHMYRVLRKGGKISIQMGFGRREGAVSYYENRFDAPGTNSACDTMVENADYLENDLRSIGFVDFDYWVRPTGPGDVHAHWIFFQATK